jgi:uncharacterized protein (DUF58 family)
MPPDHPIAHGTAAPGVERHSSGADPPGARRGPEAVDPRALMAIRNLELRARVVVEGFCHGLHRSPFHGFSVEFTEYRPYSPGDDLRYLDWRLYARSDRYYVKKFEDETNLRCHLAVDNSRSMAYGSTGYTKAAFANTLAATLAYFLYLQGDAVGLLTFDERVREYLPARYRLGHLRQLMLALDQAAGGTATDLEAPLRRLSELLRKRGLIVLISDFLAPLDALESRLRALTACRHEIILFQVLDPAEQRFDFAAASVFEDLESGREMYLDPATVRADYVCKLEAHVAALRGFCGKLGISHRRLVTDEPLELALFQFLRARLRRGRFTGRAASA